MVKYIQQEMNDLRAEGKKRSYYKVPTYSNIPASEFLRYMAENKGMINAGATQAVLQQTMETLCDWFGTGHTVTVPHLGTFRLSIGVKQGREAPSADGDEPHLNAQNIVVRGVRFKPAPEFMKKLMTDIHLEGDGLVRHVKNPTSTREERLAMLQDALQQEPFVKVIDYMRLTGLRRTMATKELASFAADPDSGITTKGRASHKVFVRK